MFLGTILVVHLFLVTGCRRGEVPDLKWGKVDWENKQISIDCNLFYRKEPGIYEDTPKTKGSIRYIRLPDQTLGLLAGYRKWLHSGTRKRVCCFLTGLTV